MLSAFALSVLAPTRLLFLKGRLRRKEEAFDREKRKYGVLVLGRFFTTLERRPFPVHPGRTGHVFRILLISTSLTFW
jgi:hypothetical protein